MTKAAAAIVSSGTTTNAQPSLNGSLSVRSGSPAVMDPLGRSHASACPRRIWVNAMHQMTIMRPATTLSTVASSCLSNCSISLCPIKKREIEAESQALHA